VWISRLRFEIETDVGAERANDDLLHSAEVNTGDESEWEHY